MSDQENGGWTAFNFSLTSAEKAVFNAALEGMVGVGYKPLAFATQVVAGTNYCFLCKGQAAFPVAPEFAALIYVNQPLQGDPHVAEISRIKP
ncbi:Uncharacterised protein [Burkholderia pseudomallei]|uniref:hypothetical protein n=1 Tax=Burkholderia pseudomallei TaxID=28450 RepID=UPI0001632204|nr:hypothetical protein [Burkholderia pseudomallei]MBF3420288.1 hypothetical protein [Burkholderia pseudomallei]MBF3431421.1 hypothetical protein [Burkholderia pseudomallei]MBF3724758.1 hypothetical protein [Burkholderia pseudomallei]MBF3734267.1 hypothetical protein [Burkholderia pseudomallei]MBF3849536.1 hypothetical protein [Burkholderia pseudomallei]